MARGARGPLATTNVVCPAPSMGEQIARDAPYVRGFLLRDNRLYLSLLADGGIYTWQPTWLLTGEYAYETGIRLTPQR